MRHEIMRLSDISWISSDHAGLKHISFTLLDRECLGITGLTDSGCDKLLQILSGCLAPDDGTIYLEGKKTVFTNVSSARKRGVYMVNANSCLNENASIAENIVVLNRTCVENSLRISWKSVLDRAQSLLDEIHFPIDARTPIRLLSPFERHVVEIVKLVYNGARVILLDRLIDSYSENDLLQLAGIINIHKTWDRSFVIATSEAKRLLGITDRIVVIRHGILGGVLNKNEYEQKNLFAIMNGSVFKNSTPQTDISSNAVVPINNGSWFVEISGRTMPQSKPFHLKLHSGEMVGLLDRDGRLCDKLDRFLWQEGEIFLDDIELRVGGAQVSIHDTAQLLQHGVAYLSSRSTGIIFNELPLAQNLTIGILNRVSASNGWKINRRMQRYLVEELFKELESLGLGAVHVDPMCATTNDLTAEQLLYATVYKCRLQRPSFLIFNGLSFLRDWQLTERLIPCLSSFLDMGTAILIVSNNNRDIVQMCSQTYVLNNGELLADV